MSQKIKQAFVDRDGYSTIPGPTPPWMADPGLLPRKSVAQILAEREESKPTKRRAR